MGRLTENSGEANMTQKIRISLLAKHEIAIDGLRNVFAGDYFHVEAAVPGGAGLVGRLERPEVDAGSHVIVIDGGDRRFGVDACRFLAAKRIDARLALLLDHYIRGSRRSISDRRRRRHHKGDIERSVDRIDQAGRLGREGISLAACGGPDAREFFCKPR